MRSAFGSMSGDDSFQKNQIKNLDAVTSTTRHLNILTSAIAISKERFQDRQAMAENNDSFVDFARKAEPATRLFPAERHLGTDNSRVIPKVGSQLDTQITGAHSSAEFLSHHRDCLLPI